MATTIEEAIQSDLLTKTTVTNYCGPNIFLWEKSRQVAGDYIVITNPSHTREMITQIGEKSGQARLQFNCWSENIMNAKAAAEAILDVYRGRRGAIQGITVFDIEIGEARPLPGAKENRYLFEAVFSYFRPSS
jgi:hypothetical protein